MKEAFIKIYDETVGEVFTYCYVKTGNKEVSAAIVDKTFKKQWDLMRNGYALASNAKSNIFILAAQLLTEEESGTLPLIPTGPGMTHSPLTFA